jgi:TolB-like protein
MKSSCAGTCLKAMLMLVLAVFAFARAEAEKEHIAIINICVQEMDSSKAMIFSDRLGTELFKTQAFRVIERDKMNEILEEQEFQQSDCTTEECIVQMGQLLGVSHIITGTISKVGETYSINLRMVNVGSGEIAYTDNEDCKCKIDNVLTQSTRAIAGKMAAYIRGEPLPDPVSASSGKSSGSSSKAWIWIAGGAVAAGVAGGVFYYLSQDEAEPETITLERDVNVQ